MLDGLTSPDADQQEHGGEFNFPEEEEEKQIHSREDAHHTSFKQQEQGHIFLHAHLLPTANHGQHSQQRVQNDQGQAQTINTQEEIDFEADRTSFKVNP